MNVGLCLGVLPGQPGLCPCNLARLVASGVTLDVQHGPRATCPSWTLAFVSQWPYVMPLQACSTGSGLRRGVLKRVLEPRASRFSQLGDCLRTFKGLLCGCRRVGVILAVCLLSDPVLVVCGYGPQHGSAGLEARCQGTEERQDHETQEANCSAWTRARMCKASMSAYYASQLRIHACTRHADKNMCPLRCILIAACM